MDGISAIGGLAMSDGEFYARIVEIVSAIREDIGGIGGRLDGLTQRMDQQNGVVIKHEERLGTLETASATNAGVSQTKKTIWKYVWQVIVWFASPAAGIIIALILLGKKG